MVALYEVLKGAIELAVLDLYAPALCNRRTVAVSTGNEDNVVLTYSVT